jgi:ribosomal protein S18 acetylase RimI-like enzyme
MPEFSIRPYRPTDREAVLRIAADSAFFGEPVEAFLEDRCLFCDFFYAYYIDFEPEYAWVACADATVVGFLVGSRDTRARPRRWLRSILPRVARGFLRGGYHLGRLTFRYVSRLAGESLKRHISPDPDAFPAHLHVNLAADWRNVGLGRRLMVTFLDQLRTLGSPGVHLSTTSLNPAACHLYENLGFHLLSAFPTGLWEGLVPGPVENRCYGLELFRPIVQPAGLGN